MFVVSHLRSLQALEVALRTGSFKAAAEALAITPAAVGQRIKMLEDRLGVELVVRGRSGLKPAPALAEALPHLRRGFAELGAAAEAMNLQGADVVRIVAPSDLADLWLAPRLPRFCAAHPGIAVRIDGRGDAPPRLGRDDVELGFGPWDDDVGGAVETDDLRDLLFHDLLAPIASPAVAARIRAVEPGRRLDGVSLLNLDVRGDDPTAPSRAEWSAVDGDSGTPPPRGPRFRDLSAALEAVSADAGLAICGLALILDRLRAGEVALPFAISTGRRTRHAFQARYGPGARARPQVATFRAWLRAEARATAAELDALAAGAPITGAPIFDAPSADAPSAGARAATAPAAVS